jgi:uncharacterized protein YcfL
MTPALVGAALLAGALMVGGCKTTTVNTVERATPTAQKQMVADKRVLTDTSLAEKVYVVGVNEAVTPGGLIQVQLEVFNTTTSRKRFNYSFQWFDMNGMLMGPTTASIVPCVIEGKETRYLSSVAPTLACKDFRVKFIESSSR